MANHINHANRFGDPSTYEEVASASPLTVFNQALKQIN